MAYPDFRNILMASSAAVVAFVAAPAWAEQVRTFDIAAQPASSGITAFSRQADVQILAAAAAVEGRRTSQVVGEMTIDAALRQLLSGSGLVVTSNDGRTYTLGVARQTRSDLSEESTAVADIIVTAQKREQSIQDVPIAVSAFSAENLDAMKIEGGSELLRAIPNVAFSKNNFSMYNFAIRGIGTKAISAASDPAVAISFNNSPMIRNRLFESEYLDVNRVEVLRGPQGTLYGRNATAGVVNMIPNLPAPDFDAMLKTEAGNYGSVRGQMMINIPLSDTFWVRGAASLTKRDGFDLNTHNGNKVNGRDLYSNRLSALWSPTNDFSLSLIWEHFGEDDNRSRTGKQLCSPDPGLNSVGSYQLTDPKSQARFSQGCLPKSLYSDTAYGTPNGSGMAQLLAAAGFSYGYREQPDGTLRLVTGVDAYVNPFEDVVQSKNLREISTSFDPVYRAANDLLQLNISYDFNENLSLNYQGMFTKDSFWSTQDYMRYVGINIINDSSGLVTSTGVPIKDSIAAPGGIYTDPQLGPSSRMEALDLSSSKNSQQFHEIRINSNFDGRVNFILGANYLDFKTEDNYYVFNNIFSLISEYRFNTDLIIGQNTEGLKTNNCTDGSKNECIYVDRTGIRNLAGDGHNYFRSKNVVSTNSWSIFGEGYIKLSNEVNATIGARYTSDEKISTPYPSQLLLGSWDLFGSGYLTGGKHVRGYHPLPDIEQSWDAMTGRFVIDWKPIDGTMIYASYARGYKGGGVNPPRADIDTRVVQYQPMNETFNPEYLNSYEVGLKKRIDKYNIYLSATAFYYDYEDYQVSQIVDRISLNENFNAESKGFELEFAWKPSSQLRIDGNWGYLKTKIDHGESSIDVMNRTQGNKDWIVLRPWVQVPSNCIAPASIAEKILEYPLPEEFTLQALQVLCGGSIALGTFDPNFGNGQGLPLWALFGFNYNPLTDAPNGGRGFAADLSGNELPNAPRWTANVGAQYTWFIGNSELTLRGDYYRQADSYFRVYNTEYDQIRGWDNLNLAVTWDMPQSNTTIQAYVKNVFDDAPIVDAFTNSDDSMLTTNVFTLDPRVWGVSLTKRF